jgi:aconitate hydratase
VAGNHPNSFESASPFQVGDASYEIYRLAKIDGADRLPYSLKILLENLLRTEDGANITADHVRSLAEWNPAAEPHTEIQFTPARVIIKTSLGYRGSWTWPRCVGRWSIWAATRPRSTH